MSLGALRSGLVEVDPATAIETSDAYLASVGQPGTTSVAGQTVTVRIKTFEPTVILGIVGIDRIGITVTASAVDVHGVTRGD